MQNAATTGALLLATFLTPAPSPSPILTSPIIQATEIRNYTVLEGDTLIAIAQKEYGSKDYWTTIWNDNPWIENPNKIEKNWTLKLNPNKPIMIEGLNEELAKKLNSQKKIAINIIQAPKSLNQPANSEPIQISPQSLNEAQLNFLGNCEAGMNPTRNSGNGYYGAFQFSLGTWNSMNTGYERADLAPIEVQKDAVQRLLSRSSIWGQFPGCARAMQAAGLL